MYTFKETYRPGDEKYEKLFDLFAVDNKPEKPFWSYTEDALHRHYYHLTDDTKMIELAAADGQMFAVVLYCDRWSPVKRQDSGEIEFTVHITL